MKQLKIALYGQNGHQIYPQMRSHPRVRLCGYAKIAPKKLCGIPAFDDGTAKEYPDLATMLKESGADLVCLCSPRRCDQAADAILALEHRVAVLAEKPAALSEEALDAILAAAKRYDTPFHEIADTAFFEPYDTMRRLIADGAVGEVVQVYAQKSYPSNFDTRPADEQVDGGLLRQAGIHAMRFLSHVVGKKVLDIQSIETNKGITKEGSQLRSAASCICTLEGGAIASVCINYCNPKSFGLWGNECIRVFGTKGMCEITDGGRHTMLYNEAGAAPFDLTDSKCPDFFDCLVSSLLDGTQMPLSLSDELHPLRTVIRAKNNATDHPDQI